jgi:hypothetical protein
MVKTKSSVFILPMIMGIPIKYFSGFANVFIGSSFGYGGITESTDRIFLVFKTSLLKEHYYTKNDITVENKDRKNKLKSTPQYAGVQVIGNYIIFIYRPADKLLKDYNRFKEGKYSEFSGKYKTIIKKYYPTSERVNNILNPSNKDRDKLAKELAVKLDGNCEVFSSPDDLEESFSYAKFLELNV